MIVSERDKLVIPWKINSRLEPEITGKFIFQTFMFEFHGNFQGDRLLLSKKQVA